MQLSKASASLKMTHLSNHSVEKFSVKDRTHSWSKESSSTVNLTELSSKSLKVKKEWYSSVNSKDNIKMDLASSMMIMVKTVLATQSMEVHFTLLELK